MKVLALVVVIMAISGMEAGLVKREAPAIPNLDEIAEQLKTFAETFKDKVQEFVSKIHSPEVQSQYQQYLEQSRAHVEPVKAQVENWFTELLAKIKNSA
ncbi:Hypothetical predicted protein [Pelobates cultripes]|uniref:Apolipoprotein A-II n=1 Tax=Pelobates cultripes TaxID=61616 RepID=A0AAD1TNH7_PELCU|nr:Hypothetical predicted protein [Pelobates cultripes]